MSNDTSQNRWNRLTGQPPPSETRDTTHTECWEVIRALRAERDEYHSKLKESEDRARQLQSQLSFSERKLWLKRNLLDKLRQHNGNLVEKLSESNAKLDSEHCIENCGFSSSSTTDGDEREGKSRLAHHHKEVIRGLVDPCVHCLYDASIDTDLPTMFCLSEGTSSPHVECVDTSIAPGKRGYRVSFGTDDSPLAERQHDPSVCNEIVKRRTLTVRQTGVSEDLIHHHLRMVPTTSANPASSND
ncbi:hypothetical protein I302_108689 [Kwoniella bestiolae CBS 10118]|uniref:Uncharacterized protein n=1 Tax=Kwoniella bestiolae CBS 10118 TaxID=1296100 RepID=A0A1B9FTU1_9TREE|nr:hypothetical protein I302_07825 [Kwoniella bestiolae CBS 10118]OCF22181.1 hypothetical protein I302_07825 [Kwoniella bestiolae CBS 10118]